eukprot:CAMPEP_0179850756 /NCGR_PEP_ID=MMETSP0982-20121206/7880_1 /TAXON_ID=483367 /ORGANISM="non described non described, Strain CCMP 2436" /LENGTH=136 /DNA_ID=CAMNT_0021736217 /DNA_START=252 /DNA_END=660 /DNA_ORIENTATION=+
MSGLKNNKKLSELLSNLAPDLEGPTPIPISIPTPNAPMSFNANASASTRQRASTPTPTSASALTAAHRRVGAHCCQRHAEAVRTAGARAHQRRSDSLAPEPVALRALQRRSDSLAPEPPRAAAHAAPIALAGGGAS